MKNSNDANGYASNDADEEDGEVTGELEIDTSDLTTEELEELIEEPEEVTS